MQMEIWCPKHGRMAMLASNVTPFSKCRHCGSSAVMVCRGTSPQCVVVHSYCRFHGCHIGADPFPHGGPDTVFDMRMAYGTPPVPAGQAAAPLATDDFSDLPDLGRGPTRRGIF
jgi:hypothetical protein